ncbi:MAG TPA: serine hydrolase domain-containing protein [Caulobacteraceae bacterium]|nr:serine hydrolase domain-containing protein [Caulobacteraceae bacterium]
MSYRNAARLGGVSGVALALAVATAPPAWAQPRDAVQGPTGRWVGAGVQVDWLGHPMEIARIVVSFDSQGNGTIDYPTLGCAGTLTRIAAGETLVEYRETLTSGQDKCPSGGTVSLRQAGDRWVYNWAVQSDWLKPDALASLGLPAQPAAGPDGDWVRSGVLAAEPAPRAFAPRDPAASADQRADRIEQSIVPPVLVAGETPAPVTLAQRMADLHVPGLGVVVIHKGRIDWARSYGVARPDGARVTNDTLFQAASISKPVTAMVTLSLAQQKLIDLDIDVDSYLHDWKIPRDPDAAGHPITLRQLLDHTAGVSVHGFAGYASGTPIPTLDQILTGQPPSNSAPFRIDTAPGVLWRYSGGGYVIIRKVLESVTGTPFAELARRNVLAPSGMTHSSFAQPLPPAQLADAAAPYGPDGQPLKEGAHVYPEVTPDGLWTTPSDLARFAIQVQQALNGAPNPILPKPMAREMLEQGGLANWGLGWGLGGTEANPYFWHSGSNAGFKSMLFAYGDGEGVVVMTNSDAGERLASDIARSVAYEYGWPDFRPLQIAPVQLSATQLDGLVGRYRIGRFSTLTVTRRGAQLFAATPDRPSFRIYPKSPTEWFAIDPDGFYPNPQTQLVFSAGGVAMRKDGYDTVAPRLAGAEADRLDAALAARVAAKTETADVEPALRRYIDQMQQGAPDYTTLSTGAGYITRLMLLNFADAITGLGKLTKLEFKGVGPNGADEFALTFEHGAAMSQILMGEDGKIELVLLASPAFF